MPINVSNLAFCINWTLQSVTSKIVVNTNCFFAICLFYQKELFGHKKLHDYFLHLKFYLPTGTKVEFRKGSLNIYPSASDRNNVEGVCGNYNGDKDDDFIIKDTGDMDPNTYAPNDFSNSWR